MGILSNADQCGAVDLIWLKRIGLVSALASLWVVSAAVAQLVINPPVSDVHINGHTYTNSQLQSNPAAWLSGVANDVGAATALYPTGRFSPRVKLVAALDMYVNSASGNDTNNCLVGNPCLTIQRPFDLLRDGYDLANNVVTVHLADGSYSPGLNLRTKLLGQHGQYNLILLGNEANPQNVIIADPAVPASELDEGAGTPIFVAYGGNVSVRGVTLVAGYRAAWAHVFGNLYLRNVRFGPSNNCHAAVSSEAILRFDGDYSIYGGGLAHYCAFNGGTIFAFGSPQNAVHVSITNAPNFSVFALAQNISRIFAQSSSTIFSGSASGQRYVSDTNSLIGTNGSGTTYFPGSIAGAVATGGLYN